MNYRLLVVFQPVSRSQASKIVDEFRPMLIYTDIPIILLKENKSRINLDFVYKPSGRTLGHRVLFRDDSDFVFDLVFFRIRVHFFLKGRIRIRSIYPGSKSFLGINPVPAGMSLHNILFR